MSSVHGELTRVNGVKPLRRSEAWRLYPVIIYKTRAGHKPWRCSHTQRPCMSFSQTRIDFNLVSGQNPGCYWLPHIYHASYFKCYFALSLPYTDDEKTTFLQPRECLHDVSFCCQRTPFIYHRKLHRLRAVDQRGIFFPLFVEKFILDSSERLGEI
jgi:hypothetical protein